MLEAVRSAADRLSADTGPESLAAVAEVHRLLTERLLPHEYAEEHELYPALAPALGGPGGHRHDEPAPTPRSNASPAASPPTSHSRRQGRAPAPGTTRRTCGPALYGLHTVLRLHFTQEEENYFSLAP